MKVSKRLITSLVCLLLSVVVCVWACFAWFSINKNVNSGDVNTAVIDSNDIKSFTITSYYLNYNSNSDTTNFVTASSGNVDHDGASLPTTYDKYDKDGNETVSNGTVRVGDGILQSGDTMRSYDLVGVATAVLLELDMQFSSDAAGKTFALTVTSEATDFKLEENNTKGYLSTVANFGVAKATTANDNTTYTYATDENNNISYKLFAKQSDIWSLDNSLDLLTLTVTSDTTKCYIILDYNISAVNYIYSYNELPLTAAVEFKNDLTFTLSEVEQQTT
jgi:hypothetical protein